MSKVIKLSERNINPLTRDSIVKTVFFKVTENPNIPDVLKEKHVLKCSFEYSHSVPSGFGAYFFFGNKSSNFVHHENSYHLSDEFSYLSSGDVVRVTPGPNLRVVFRKKNPTNYITITEQCNSFCVMCSQPPRPEDDSYLFDEYISSLPLFDIDAREIGISGGEPTLNEEKFVKLLNSINCYLPRTSIHVLSNGKSFAKRNFVEEVAKTNHYDLMFGIPLYSSVPYIHDYIVQDRGAFQKTINGILNLKQYGQKIELRFVIQEANYSDLELFAEFVSRNLQFIDQVAFMALEATGFARSNFDSLWVEPHIYASKLLSAVSILNKYKIKVRLFNFQLCTLPKELWSCSVKSISDWKNCYIDECSLCTVKSACGGFFSTSDGRIPESIKAVV